MSGLRDCLIRTPAVHQQLGHALAPGSSQGGERVSGGSVERPLPIRGEVADHRHALLPLLRWWVSSMETTLADRPHTFGPQPAGVVATPATMCAWLLHTHTIMSDRAQWTLRAHLAQWLDKAGKYAGQGQDTRVALVPLPHACLNVSVVDDVELFRCMGTLQAGIPAARSVPAYLTCKDCRARWEVTELPAAANIRLPVHVAADLLGVSVRTVQRRTRSDRESGVVRLGDLLECATPVA